METDIKGTAESEKREFVVLDSNRKRKVVCYCPLRNNGWTVEFQSDPDTKQFS